VAVAGGVHGGGVDDTIIAGTGAGIGDERSTSTVAVSESEYSDPEDAPGGETVRWA
jgi:hypothetical protein